jgi:hypothetical protein
VGRSPEEEGEEEGEEGEEEGEGKGGAEGEEEGEEKGEEEGVRARNNTLRTFRCTLTLTYIHYTHMRTHHIWSSFISSLSFVFIQMYSYIFPLVVLHNEASGVGVVGAREHHVVEHGEDRAHGVHAKEEKRREKGVRFGHICNTVTQ